MTITDALNHLIEFISRDPDASILTVTLRRLAVICANREDGPELLEGFRDAYYKEASNVRHLDQLRVVMRGRN